MTTSLSIRCNAADKQQELTGIALSIDRAVQDLVRSEVFAQGRAEAEAQRAIEGFFEQVLGQQGETACKVDQILRDAEGANR